MQVCPMSAMGTCLRLGMLVLVAVGIILCCVRSDSLIAFSLYSCPKGCQALPCTWQVP